MDVIKLHYPLANKQYLTEKTVIAMGFFDGFHRAIKPFCSKLRPRLRKGGPALLC